MSHGPIGCRALGGTTNGAGRAASLLLVSGLGVGLAAAMSGCEVDSFMDPSIIGRWQHTPTTVPILDRLSSIEDADTEAVEYSEVTVADLIPEPNEYRIGPGDRLLVTLYDDIDNRGIPSNYERDVDIRGNIDLPQLGQINLANKTAEQARQIIAAALSKFVNDPLVSVVVAAQRQQTFTIMGEVQQPGPYFIAKPDYRLLEALTAPGRFPESIEEIYIIRQIPLTDAVKGVVPPPPPGPAGDRPSPTATPPSAVPAPKPPEKVIDLIDELTKPKEDPKDPEPKKEPAVEPKSPSPAVFGPRPPSLAGANRPARPAPQPPAQPAPKEAEPGRPPAVDLVDPAPNRGTTPGPDGVSPSPGKPAWIFVNGQWVQARLESSSVGNKSDGPATADQLLAQRVIRVPVKPLLAGQPQYNIVIRPGDIIRVPSPPVGLVYVVGQVQRPGPYNMPDVGHLTILRAIDAAGGLSPIAIPERVDITRVVGKDRQATLRLDLRAMSQGTMPDIYLRRDDRINVGTNFWAYPLAVFRNGFRVSYGFGFVLDRNFADNVFGVQTLR